MPDHEHHSERKLVTGLLFGSQTFYWIYNRRFDSPEAYCNNSNQNSQQNSQGKNPPADIYPVSEILQPFIHREPGYGRSNYKRNNDKL